jgi:hypothetical protein
LPGVFDSGEGRWRIKAAINEAAKERPAWDRRHVDEMERIP